MLTCIFNESECKTFNGNEKSPACKPCAEDFFRSSKKAPANLPPPLSNNSGMTTDRMQSGNTTLITEPFAPPPPPPPPLPPLPSAEKRPVSDKRQTETVGDKKATSIGPKKSAPSKPEKSEVFVNELKELLSRRRQQQERLKTNSDT